MGESMRPIQFKALFLGIVLLSACSKKESDETPQANAPAATQAASKPGILSKGSLGAALLLKSQAADTYTIKLVFPNSQVGGTSSPQGQADVKYSKRQYPVQVEGDVFLYDSKGLLGKITLPPQIQGSFWCENDGGSQYRPEHVVEIKKSALKRPLALLDKNSSFTAFALVDENVTLGPITYKIPENSKVLFEQKTMVGADKFANAMIAVWNDKGVVKSGPYTSLIAGSKSYALTCDGP